MQKLTLNNVTLGGNISSGVTLKTVQGIECATFNLAIEDGMKEKPHTTQIPCFASHELATTINKWFAKHDRILVTGALKTGSVTGKATEQLHVVVQKVHLVESPERGAISLPTTRTGTRSPADPILLDTQE